MLSGWVVRLYLDPTLGGVSGGIYILNALTTETEKLIGDFISNCSVELEDIFTLELLGVV